MLGNKDIHILPYYDDARDLLPHIRRKDYLELKAAGRELRMRTKSLLRYIAQNSVEAVSVFYGKYLLACAGVFPEPKHNEAGSLWLLSTTWADKFPVAYYKACLMLRKRGLERFPAGLYTTTAENYTKALKLNERLGFRKVANVVIGDKPHIRYFLEGKNGR